MKISAKKQECIKDRMYYVEMNAECQSCPDAASCKADRQEIETFVRKWGERRILPFMHGATVVCYVEDHLQDD